MDGCAIDSSSTLEQDRRKFLARCMHEGATILHHMSEFALDPKLGDEYLDVPFIMLRELQKTHTCLFFH